MTRYLDGPTARSPEPSPPETDDPGMVDPQDLDDAGRRAWIAVAGDAIKDELLLRLMGENDVLLAERNTARTQFDSAIRRLVRIHSFITPQDVRLPDGRVFEFNNPAIEHEMLRGLSKAIRDTDNLESAP